MIMADVIELILCNYLLTSLIDKKYNKNENRLFDTTFIKMYLLLQFSFSSPDPKFPTVILYEDLEAGLMDIEDQHLLLFGVMSLSEGFFQCGEALLSYHLILKATTPF